MSWWKGLFTTQKESKSQLYSAGEINKIISESVDEPDCADPLYPEVVFFVLSTERCSISAVQRHFKIGYIRAARIIESLEFNQIISAASHDGTRQIFNKQQRTEAVISHLNSIELEKQRIQDTLDQRAAYLKQKYNNAATVEAILEGKVWESMTEEQLIDSIGKPEAIDNKQMKRKSRDVWKYQHRGGSRYGLRITIENGFVVGWDSKS